MEIPPLGLHERVLAASFVSGHMRESGVFFSLFCGLVAHVTTVDLQLHEMGDTALAKEEALCRNCLRAFGGRRDLAYMAVIFASALQEVEGEQARREAKWLLFLAEYDDPNYFE